MIAMEGETGGWHELFIKRICEVSHRFDRITFVSLLDGWKERSNQFQGLLTAINSIHFLLIDGRS
jgi:hypothetical protein